MPGRSRPDTTAPGCCAPPAAWWRPRPAWSSCPGGIPPHARTALAGTSVPAGKILAPLGVQRLDRRALCRHGCLDAAGGDVAVQSSAVLALDGAKVAIATERITGDLCRLIATSSRT